MPLKDASTNDVYYTTGGRVYQRPHVNPLNGNIRMGGAVDCVENAEQIASALNFYNDIGTHFATMNGEAITTRINSEFHPLAKNG